MYLANNQSRDKYLANSEQSRDMYLAANQLIDFAATAATTASTPEKSGKPPGVAIRRHTSVDSPLRHHHSGDGTLQEAAGKQGPDGELPRTPCKSTLGLLCDVASERIQAEGGLSVPQARSLHLILFIKKLCHLF